jgi:hypothetical protein
MKYRSLRAPDPKPQSGERIKPTAPAVGKLEERASREAAKEQFSTTFPLPIPRFTVHPEPPS